MGIIVVNFLGVYDDFFIRKENLLCLQEQKNY